MAKQTKTTTTKKAAGKNAKAAAPKAKAARVAVNANGRITILVKANPYRTGSRKHKVFATLAPNMPVATFVAKQGNTLGDLSRMVRFGRIAVK